MVYEQMEITMLRQSMFVILGLMAAVTLGCEKKQEAPAAPDAAAVEDHAGEAHDAAGEHMEEAKDAIKDAAEEAKEAGEEASEAAKDAIDGATAPQ